jgi:hypothetical protein
MKTQSTGGKKAGCAAYACQWSTCTPSVDHLSTVAVCCLCLSMEYVHTISGPPVYCGSVLLMLVNGVRAHHQWTNCLLWQCAAYACQWSTCTPSVDHLFTVAVGCFPNVPKVDEPLKLTYRTLSQLRRTHKSD